MKKILAFIILGIILIIPSNVSALNEVNIYFFYSDSCKICKEEKPYLEALKDRYFNVRIYSYDADSDTGRDLMNEAKKLYNITTSGVPFTIIGDTPFAGFSQASKCNMEKAIYNYSYNKYENKFGTQILTIGYSSELQGDVEKRYDDGESNYVVEEKGEAKETTTVKTETKSMSKKYSASIILAGIGLVCLMCVLFISIIERKKRII